MNFTSRPTISGLAQALLHRFAARHSALDLDRVGRNPATQAPVQALELTSCHIVGRGNQPSTLSLAPLAYRQWTAVVFHWQLILTTVDCAESQGRRSPPSSSFCHCEESQGAVAVAAVKRFPLNGPKFGLGRKRWRIYPFRFSLRSGTNLATIFV